MNLKTNYIETGLHVPHLGLEGAPEQHGVSQASRRVVQGLGGGDQGGHSRGAPLTRRPSQEGWSQKGGRHIKRADAASNPSK
eukprot:1155839-Pelagomonas_calceolata.AAC.10